MRFFIRDLFWLTLVVAMGLGWWLHYRTMHANRQAVVRHAERAMESLRNAKNRCEVLERDAKFYLDAARESGAIIRYLSFAPAEVDWTVLDEPIPSP